MKFILPLILAAVLSSTASAQPLETGPAVLGTKPLTLKLVVPKSDHCPGCPKAPAQTPGVLTTTLRPTPEPSSASPVPTPVLPTALPVVPLADHCPGGKCPARVVPVVPYAVPQAAPVYRATYRVTVRERIVTGERRPVRRVFGRVFGFMGACR